MSCCTLETVSVKLFISQHEVAGVCFPYQSNWTRDWQEQVIDKSLPGSSESKTVHLRHTSGSTELMWIKFYNYIVEKSYFILFTWYLSLSKLISNFFNCRLLSFVMYQSQCNDCQNLLSDHSVRMLDFKIKCFLWYCCLWDFIIVDFYLRILLSSNSTTTWHRFQRFS